MRTAMAFALVVATLSLHAKDPPASPEAERAEAVVLRLVESTDAVRDYRVILTKQQRIRGELRPAETMALKHRRNGPECRYLSWLEGPNEGRELLHCAGRNDNEMLVHEGGFLGLITISLDPHGDRARRDDLRPITETGIYSLARFAAADRAHLREAGDTRVEMSARAVHGQPSTCVATPTGTSLIESYEAGRREICVQDALGLPTEVRIWDQAGELMEHYTFRSYETNPGLTDADFDPENPEYDF